MKIPLLLVLAGLAIGFALPTLLNKQTPQHRVRREKLIFLEPTIGQARRKSFNSIPTD